VFSSLHDRLAALLGYPEFKIAFPHFREFPPGAVRRIKTISRGIHDAGMAVSESDRSLISIRYPFPHSPFSLMRIRIVDSRLPIAKKKDETTILAPSAIALGIVFREADPPLTNWQMCNALSLTH
jgi:hypothetical protein